MSYRPDGNLNVSGRISVNGAGIELAPSGNFVNSYAGNPFTANSTRILSKDLFSKSTSVKSWKYSLTLTYVNSVTLIAVWLE